MNIFHKMNEANYNQQQQHHPCLLYPTNIKQKKNLYIITILIIVVVPIVILPILLNLQHHWFENVLSSSSSSIMRIRTVKHQMDSNATTTITTTTPSSSSSSSSSLLLATNNTMNDPTLENQEEEEHMTISSTSSESTGRVHNYTTGRTNTTMMTNNNNNVPKGIVWLVSFPNSGTTYTISIVQSMTNTSTATNYGGNERDSKNNSIPVFSSNDHHDDHDMTQQQQTNTNNINNNNNIDDDGPFYRTPGKLHNGQYYNNANIITKTHCEQHIQGTLLQFITSCATGTKYINYTSIPVTYVPQLHLSGMIYLVRNPFHNIIGRMNYQRNQWLRSKDPIDHQRASFFPPHNRTGFYWWCQYKDRKKSQAQIDLLQTNNGTFYTQYLQDIPCYMEFYLYFRWHNMVNEMISYFNHNHNISSMIIYYENYDTNHTTDRKTIIEPMLYDILHFTPEQIVNHTIPQFVKSSDNDNIVVSTKTTTTTSTTTTTTPYNNATASNNNNNTMNHTMTIMMNDMYTLEQQIAIQRLAQVMTTPQTWSVLKHYFQSI